MTDPQFALGMCVLAVAVALIVAVLLTSGGAVEDAVLPPVEAPPAVVPFPAPPVAAAPPEPVPVAPPSVWTWREVMSPPVVWPPTVPRRAPAPTPEPAPTPSVPPTGTVVRLVSEKGRSLGTATLTGKRRPVLSHRTRGGKLGVFVVDSQNAAGEWVYRRVSVEHER